MLKRQAEDRIELLRGGGLKLDDDVDEVCAVIISWNAQGTLAYVFQVIKFQLFGDRSASRFELDKDFNAIKIQTC